MERKYTLSSLLLPLKINTGHWIPDVKNVPNVYGVRKEVLFLKKKKEYSPLDRRVCQVIIDRKKGKDVIPQVWRKDSLLWDTKE